MLLRDTTRIKKDFWRKDMFDKSVIFKFLVMALEEVEAELEAFSTDYGDEKSLQEDIKEFNDFIHSSALLSEIGTLPIANCVLDDVYKCREQVAEWFNN